MKTTTIYIFAAIRIERIEQPPRPRKKKSAKGLRKLWQYISPIEANYRAPISPNP